MAFQGARLLLWSPGGIVMKMVNKTVYNGQRAPGPLLREGGKGRETKRKARLGDVQSYLAVQIPGPGCRITAAQEAYSQFTGKLNNVGRTVLPAGFRKVVVGSLPPLCCIYVLAMGLVSPSWSAPPALCCWRAPTNPTTLVSVNISP